MRKQQQQIAYFKCPNCDYSCTAASKRLVDMKLRLHKDVHDREAAREWFDGFSGDLPGGLEDCTVFC